jgi:phospholipid-binding lipoprotein MlaA
MRTLLLMSLLAATCCGTAAAREADNPDEFTPGDDPKAQEEVFDPLEGMNRRLFAVHNTLDRWVMAPVARGYRAIAPRPVRNGVSNFLGNLGAPVVLANDLLQGKPVRAGKTLARFGVNTTVGVLGIFDPAASIGLEPHNEDFGQTLAVWGVGEGPYIFVPLLGPTNVRDGVGHMVDSVFDPFTWAQFEGDQEFALVRGVGGAVSGREELLDVIDSINDTSIDPYARFRSIYGMMRESDI